MPNHYHLFVVSQTKQGIEKLMRSVMTAYSRYFNTKYQRVGGLFQNHFWPHTLDQMVSLACESVHTP